MSFVPQPQSPDQSDALVVADSWTRPTAEALFGGGGEMGERIRALDWSATPIGPMEHWPQSLRTALNICLNSRFPMVLWWGPELVLLYNDAWRPCLGATKHPQALGRPGQEVWPEIWDIIGPQLNSVLATGQATWSDDLLLPMDRYGYTEETYYTYSYSPIHLETGQIGGVFTAVTETTQRVLSERRLGILRDLAALGQAKTAELACQKVMQTLAENAADVPFALIYLLDDPDQPASLVGTTGLEPGTPAAPSSVELTATAAAPWPLWQVAHSAQARLVETSGLGALPGGLWPEPSRQALVLPIAAPGQERPTGLLVAGVSPRRALDDSYRDFFNLVAGQIATAVTNAHVYAEERERAEALAELDRAKTMFFSNVSHEFRTPLTLMLGPVEDALADTEAPLPTRQRERLEALHRNSLRLLKLVNTLLDFSRIEAGRIQAVYEPTPLDQLTAELASAFRSATERAGLRLVVACEPLAEPVYVDRDMWEKIVLNLLSNAFKFTFEGEITVSLRPSAAGVELRVQDTGIGIPASELPRVFERFHRVQGAQARTHEGSGIGLALVQELVRLHGGRIQVESRLGEGTTLTVSLPTGTAHLPPERMQATRALTSTALGSAAYVAEALRWLPEAAANPEFNQAALDAGAAVALAEQWLSLPGLRQVDASLDSAFTPARARVLLVDDNADLRDYLKRLLSGPYTVEAVADGRAALAAIREHLPDLVLTDVMMPHLDGFGLLNALRADPRTHAIPIILLSARAGEESRIEGLEAGADDYLVKPFSARELLARVSANLKMAQLRRQAARRERQLRAETETAYTQISSILESITDAFVAFDHQWHYAYVNGAAARLLHKSREQLLGKQVWQEVFPEQVGTLTYQELHRAVAEQVSVEFEVWDQATNRWLEVSAYPSIDGLSVYFRDVTERRCAEAERLQLLERERAARAQAETANRIKDEFLAVLSHELRSPLNPILGWSSLLLNRRLDEATTRRAVETIERNARLQTQLIEDLLDVSRILQGKLSLKVCTVNLAATIEAAMETVRLAAEAKTLQIQCLLAPSPILVSGDAGRLQQVVWNLLANAVKFTPAGGRVAIRLARMGADAQITVSDTGKGITPEFMPHVFDYFRQADSATTRTFGGLGLGLAIVRHLVELHGGTVWADSEGEGLGATFTVQLPLLTASEHPTRQSQQAEACPELTGVRVLVVDDDVDTRELLVFVLEQAGAKVTAVASAKAALDSLHTSQPDVLVSDIGMPELDGYLLIRQMRGLESEQGGQIPALALTAYAAEIDQQQALTAGFQRHLAKPVEPHHLVIIVAQLVGRSVG